MANRLLRRVRDFAEVRGEGFIDGAIASEGLELFGVDSLGLDKVDRSILTTLCERFGGQPVGLTTLAQCIGRGDRHHRGRVRAVLAPERLDPAHGAGPGGDGRRAWAHLGYEVPPGAPPTQ